MLRTVLAVGGLMGALEVASLSMLLLRSSGIRGKRAVGLGALVMGCSSSKKAGWRDRSVINGALLWIEVGLVRSGSEVFGDGNGAVAFASFALVFLSVSC